MTMLCPAQGHPLPAYRYLGLLYFDSSVAEARLVHLIGFELDSRIKIFLPA